MWESLTEAKTRCGEWMRLLDGHLLTDQLSPLRQDSLSLAFALRPAALCLPVAVEGRWLGHRVRAGRLPLFRFPVKLCVVLLPERTVGMDWTVCLS